MYLCLAMSFETRLARKFAAPAQKTSEESECRGVAMKQLQLNMIRKREASAATSGRAGRKERRLHCILY